MAKTLAAQRDQARAQLGDESIEAAIPALSYRHRNEWWRLLNRFLPVPPKSQPRLLLFRSDHVDLHAQRFSKNNVGEKLARFLPTDSRLVFVEDTREGSSHIEFGGLRLTVLDEHMKALYQMARQSGFPIDADADPRSAD
ncbi:MAG: hypothetical protein AAGE98_18190 [Actinomycetota bacterium]